MMKIIVILILILEIIFIANLIADDDSDNYSKQLLLDKHLNLTKQIPEGYKTYEEIIALADSLTFTYSDICKKTVLGLSLEGRELSALKISDNADFNENETAILFDGGIHGDEVGGPEYLIRFAKDLCEQYSVDQQITELINNREIWIFPMINPDGRVAMTRSNANGIDLNRNFGYLYNSIISDQWCSEPEAKALRTLAINNQFSLNCSYHSGIEAIYFPWCSCIDCSPDHEQFIAICTEYSNNSGYPQLTLYSPIGTMQGTSIDHLYGFFGSLSFIVELSQDKQPPIDEINQYYEWNYPAMITMIEEVGYGIEGTVTDAITGNPISAIICDDGEVPFYSDPLLGDFHHYCTTGCYNLTFKANNYRDTTLTDINVLNSQSNSIDIQMQPLPGHFAYKTCATFSTGNDYLDSNNLPYWALGRPDNLGYLFDTEGWIILDMHTPLSDFISNDLIIHGIDEGTYQCYVSSSMDGPWIYLGFGQNKTSFDISNVDNGNLRFVKIYYSGFGPNMSLDAVENHNSSTIASNPNYIISPLKIHPNPFNPHTTISFDLNKEVNIKLSVTNSKGQLITIIQNSKLSPGHHTLCWNGKDSYNHNVSSGIYIMNLETNGVVIQTQKSLLLK